MKNPFSGSHRPLAGRAVVLMDDVASSGHTVAQAARQLIAAGAASVDVAVTHALFAAGAERLIREAGAGQIRSTDCIPHASNAVSVVPGWTRPRARCRRSRAEIDRGFVAERVRWRTDTQVASAQYGVGRARRP
jgi:hypothetical protein